MIGLRSQFGTSLALAIFVVFVSLVAAGVVARRARLDGRPGLEATAKILAAGAVVATVVATALPRRFGIETDGDLVLQLGRGGLSEWRTLFTDPLSLAAIELVGNVLLYVAVAFTMVVGWFHQRRLVLAACLALSVVIETAQFSLLGRVAAIDDVLLNMAGAVIGYLAASALVPLVVGDRMHSERSGGQQLVATALDERPLARPADQALDELSEGDDATVDLARQRTLI